MSNTTCQKCGNTYDNEMQLEFHICLDVDPIEEAAKETEEPAPSVEFKLAIKLDTSALNMQDYIGPLILRQEIGDVLEKVAETVRKDPSKTKGLIFVAESKEVGYWKITTL